MKNYFRFVVFALLGLMCTQWASAQIVTISPQTGNLVAAQGAEVSQGTAGSTEVGMRNGLSGLWRHNQLPLSFANSDYPQTTSFGQLATPANNMKYVTDSEGTFLHVIATNEGYFSLVLPRGYRFTSYRIIFNDIYTDGGKISNNSKNEFVVERDNWNFVEMDQTFTKVLNDPIAFSSDQPTGEKGYNRQSDDMSNVLYFKLTGGQANSSQNGIECAALKISYFEATFEVDQHFTALVQPTDEVYEKVTSPNSLSAGDQVLIVYNNGTTYQVMGRQPGGYDFYRTSPAITVSNNQIVLKATNVEPSRFTLGSGSVSNTWTFYSTTNTAGYLYSYYSDNARAYVLGTQHAEANANNFTITFTDQGNVSLQNSSNNRYIYRTTVGSGTNQRNIFNVTSSSNNVSGIQIWKRVSKVADATAVSLAESPFATGRMDIGSVGYQSLGNTYEASSATVFNYTNLKDLYGNIQLYNATDGTNDKIADNDGDKTITPAVKGNEYYYNLKAGTYYLETPSTAKDQSNKDIPVGYRITGVKVHFTK